MCTITEARGRNGTREDVRIERRDVRVPRKEGNEVGGRRLMLIDELAPPWTSGLRPLPLSLLNVSPRWVLKERAELALVMADMRMPARPAMLKVLTAWMTGAVAERRRI
jgi:hypothetical protein